MDAIEAIHGRRSIRSYGLEPVPEATIEVLLRAAMAAPSAGNQQPWQFVVLDDRKLLDRIPEYHPYASALREAPVGIVVCGDTRLEKYKGFWVQDCSAAIQNLLVAAHAEGLGTVWLGVYPLGDRVRETQKLLDLPEEVLPLAVIALGTLESRRAMKAIAGACLKRGWTLRRRLSSEGPIVQAGVSLLATRWSESRTARRVLRLAARSKDMSRLFHSFSIPFNKL